MDSTHPHTIRRRRLVAGAAWAVPAAMVVGAAPAQAASVCQPGCPTMGFGGGLNRGGWSYASSGNFAQGVNQRIGFLTSYTPWPGTDACTLVTGGTAGGTLLNVIVGEADPTSAGAQLIYSIKLCLKGGVTYTFTYAWNAYCINSRAAYEQASIGWTATSPTLATIGSLVTAPAASPNRSGTVTGTFTPTATDVYTFRYRWTFATTPTSYTNACIGNVNGAFANDIAVQAPTVTCSPTP